MKSWANRIALIALLLGTITPLALADIPNPNNNQRTASESSSTKTSMRIEPKEDVKEAKLLIPRDVWRQLKAELDDNGSPNAAATSRFFNLSGAQTVMTGIFLSLALAFGGVWLMRLRGPADKLTRVALGLAVLALCGATASIAYANAGPPTVARSLTSKILSSDLQWWGAYGQVKVEIVAEGDEITLVLPKPKEQSH